MEQELRTQAVIVEQNIAQNVRKLLEVNSVWDPSRKLKKIHSRQVAIPIKGASLGDLDGLKDYHIQKVCLPPSKKARSPYQCMVTKLQRLFITSGDILPMFDDVKHEIPHHWESHGDLVLLPEHSFTHACWDTFGSSLWEAVSDSLNCKRVARKKVVSSNAFRSPQVEVLYGDDNWVEHIDNGIRYGFDVTCCMFSVGNITEKLRLATMDCTGETIVDLYAGIGYFTLPYLVHAKASFVHACEWNPDAVKALMWNLDRNKVADRCAVYFGDNRQVCPSSVADRVNLGLIPSSEEGWPVACHALKPMGGILHIHQNVTTKPAVGKNELCYAAKDQITNNGSFHTVKQQVTNNGLLNLTEQQDLNNCLIVTDEQQVTNNGLLDTTEQQILNNCLVDTDEQQVTNNGFIDATEQQVLNNCLVVTDEQQVTNNGFIDATEQQVLNKCLVDADEQPVMKNGLFNTTDEQVLNHCLVDTNEQQLMNNDLTTAVELQGTNNGLLNTTTKQISSIAELIDTDGDIYCAHTSSQSRKRDTLNGCILHPVQQLESKDLNKGDERTAVCKDVCDKSKSNANWVREQWQLWAEGVRSRIQRMMTNIHGRNWAVQVLHIEHVKSYAPHVDHLVLDLACHPLGDN